MHSHAALLSSSRRRQLVSVLAVGALSLSVSAVLAQESAEMPQAPSTTQTQHTTTSTEIHTGYAAPESLDDLNSYLPSSDRPSVTGEGDSFDLNRSSRPGEVTVITGEGNTAGAYSGTGVSLGTDLDGSGGIKKPRSRAVPEFHMVAKGETLWGISRNYYEDPHQWPRVWAMNPQVANPHWIYPGDQIRTARTASSSPMEDNSAGSGGFVGRERLVPAGTVFLRDIGYIGDPEQDVWGELVGAREDQMMLSKGNTVYLLLDDDVDVRLGQRLSIFKEIRQPRDVPGSRKPPGELVKIYGTVRVDAWDRDAQVARGMIIESLDVIERGSKIGPVGRRFDVVPPKKTQVDLEARLLTSVYPHIYYGTHQVIFIDKGSEDGLVPGNRLRAVRHGDTWRQNLKTGSKHTRMRVPLDDPAEAPYEMTPLRGDDDSFPDEVVGEALVLRTEEYSATCLVIESFRELIPGDKLVAVSGY